MNPLPLNGEAGRTFAAALLLGVWWLLLHYSLTSRDGDDVTGDEPAPALDGVRLNHPLFPKHVTVILRLTLRLLRYGGNLAKCCGMGFLKQMMQNLSLNLFIFCFVRWHGDDPLVYGYDEYVAKFYPGANTPNDKLTDRRANKL